ncbi:MAG: hypothetical protein H7Z12_19980 [Rhodospirillaceae bacterium]|nr:hypothetical protein [Rhodospirillales bacterium]
MFRKFFGGVVVLVVMAAAPAMAAGAEPTVDQVRAVLPAFCDAMTRGRAEVERAADREVGSAPAPGANAAAWMEAREAVSEKHRQRLADDFQERTKLDFYAARKVASKNAINCPR